MKIAVMSDTHNNVRNLEWALELIHRENITTIVHCGDLIDPQILTPLSGLRLIYVLGNGDTEVQSLRSAIMALHPENSCEQVFKGDINGVRIAATHGHIPGMVDELARASGARFVFHGHSHRRRDETLAAARVINPGALGGMKPQERSFAVVDLEGEQVNFRLLP